MAPSLAAKETLVTACVAPKCFLSPRTAIISFFSE